MRISGHSSIAFAMSASPSSISPGASALSLAESILHHATTARGSGAGAAIRGFAFAAAGIPSLTGFAKILTLRNQENSADRLPALDVSVRRGGFGQREGLIEHDLQLAARGLVD